MTDETINKLTAASKAFPNKNEKETMKTNDMYEAMSEETSFTDSSVAVNGRKKNPLHKYMIFNCFHLKLEYKLKYL